MTENETVPIPFEGDEQKAFSGGFGSNLFGLPIQVGGVDRKDNFIHTKRGVSLAYLLVPVFKSAVDVISENLASVPMVLKDKKGKIIHRSDGFGHSESKFLNAIEKSYKYYGMPLFQLWGNAILLYGENFIEKVPDTYDTLCGLKWLNPVGMSIETYPYEDKSDTIVGGRAIRTVKRKYHYSGIEGYVDYDDDEIIFSRAFNPLDDIRGYSNGLVALSKANISMEFETFVMSFYDNSGHPGLIISPKDKLVSNKDITNWRNEWQQKFRGSQNQFKTHINSFPFDAQTFEVLDISKPLEVSKDAEEKILSSFRVPPEMIGITSGNSYQFSKETKNGFMQTAVRPLALSIANAINHSGLIKLFDEDSDYKFSFDFSEFDAKGESDLRQQDILERQLKSGAISLGDYQLATGNDKSENSENIYFVPQGFSIVTREQLANPESLPQPNDNTGPDSNTMNQQERRTQSETGDQDSVEFFGSKGLTEVEIPIDYLETSDFDDVNIKQLKELSKKFDMSFEDTFKEFRDFESETL